MTGGAEPGVGQLSGVELGGGRDVVEQRVHSGCLTYMCPVKCGEGAEQCVCANLLFDSMEEEGSAHVWNGGKQPILQNVEDSATRG